VPLNLLAISSFILLHSEVPVAMGLGLAGHGHLFITKIVFGNASAAAVNKKAVLR
jgi:hypothetical protein